VLRPDAPSAAVSQTPTRWELASRRLVLVVALAIGFAWLVLHASARLLADSEDGWRTVGVARAVANDSSRFGLVDYTHHPLGPAYPLVPVVWMGRPDLIPFVPGYAGAITTGAAFGALLYIAPWPLWPGVCAAFAALLWQPGYLNWLHTTWQHSWNFCVVFVLIAVSALATRAAAWLLLAGYVAGWLGYDFVFVQVATVLAVRLAFWSQTGARGVLLAGDEAVAFITGLALAFISHIVQNALYFSSAVVAVHDLLGSLFIRVNNHDYDVPTLATRWALLQDLATGYVRLFLLPKWSHWPSLVAAGVVVAVGAAITARRLHGTRRIALPALAIVVVSLGSLIAWWTIAPGHAIPHPHFFPRMLLVPLLAILAGVVRLLSRTPLPENVRWRPAWRHALTALAVVALLPPVMFNVSESVDDHIYTHVWASTDCAPRLDRIGAPFLPATSPQAPNPATLKTGWRMVGGVNTWAQYLDDTAWRPSGAAPWIYEERFARRAMVSDVLLRFPGTPRPRGMLKTFTIELLAGTPPTTLDESSANLEITEIGFLRGFRYHLDPPLAADGLRLTIRTAEQTPILNDLLAFGKPIE
jgi:hypothetical protein